MKMVSIKQEFALIITCTVTVALFVKCKEIYDPHIEAKTTGLLVVEGFINSGVGPTTIHLSRSSSLEDTALHPEFSAQVTVEGEDGSSFTLFGNGNGEYTNAQLTLNNGVSYRLHLRTTDGKEYVSDYTPVKFTPLIDSITWQRENDGLRIYANARDPQNETKYYQWKYEETWEIHSAFYTSIKYIRDTIRTNAVIDLVYRLPDHNADTSLYRCWNTVNSSTITLGSTEKLTSDIVYLPVQYIEPHSEKLSVLYSINLRQYAIGHDNYLFLQKMKKNTEQLGTIFDPQPSEISGNIHCLTDPAEIVIGFIEVTQEQIKRIFISNSQVPDWNYDPACVQIILDNNLDSIAKHGSDLYPTLPTSLDPFGGITKFFATNDKNCMNCTFRGGTQKPAFWP
jgi:Domain of unknown function (DUF4249)